MIPWQLVDRTQTPDGQSELSLHRRGDEFVLRVGGHDLMSTRVHASEEAMADLTCSALVNREDPHVLIGGLGMGFTVAACNRALPAGAQIEVCELSPKVVEWNQGPLAGPAGNPLDDPRVRLQVGDAGKRIAASDGVFDAILLDVDNGPAPLTQKSNESLYGPQGLKRAAKALREGGILSVWSAGADERFTNRINTSGFEATVHWVYARPGKKGAKHCVWIARKLS